MISNRSLTQFTHDLNNNTITKMTVLELRNLNYDQIQWAIELLKTKGLHLTIRGVDAAHNSLNHFPVNILDLANSTHLYLHGNSLQTLPESICRLQNVTLLTLDQNKFSIFPEMILQMTNLQSLNFFNNQLETLPEGIQQLRLLRELNLSKNKITTLKDNIALPQTLIKFTLDRNPLKRVPECILELTNLIELNLYRTELETLPNRIVQLTSLTTLLLFHAQLKDLPDKIGDLNADVNIWGNPFESLPEDIAFLNLLTRSLMNNFYIAPLCALTQPKADMLKIFTPNALASARVAMCQAVRAHLLLAILCQYNRQTDNQSLRFPYIVIAEMLEHILAAEANGNNTTYTIGRATRYCGRLFASNRASIANYRPNPTANNQLQLCKLFK